MDELSCWDHLGIEPVQDRKAVKRAFARTLKTIDQEAEPERYQDLREAYELALALVELPESKFMGLMEREAVGADVGEALEDPSGDDGGRFDEAEPTNRREEFASEPDAETSADDDREAPFQSALFEEEAPVYNDPIEAARARGADVVIDMINALLRDDFETARNLLLGLRRSVTYSQDEIYRQEVEFLLMVGVLEMDWNVFPLEFAILVAEPWMEDRYDVDSRQWKVETTHPYWFEYYEFAHRVKAERAQRVWEAAAEDPRQNDFSQAADLVLNKSPRDLPVKLKAGVFSEVSQIIKRISLDMSGAFEKRILDNPNWAAWVTWKQDEEVDPTAFGKLVFYGLALSGAHLSFLEYAGMNLAAGMIFLWTLFFGRYYAARYRMQALKRGDSRVRPIVYDVINGIWAGSALVLVFAHSALAFLAIVFGIPIISNLMVEWYLSRNQKAVKDISDGYFRHERDPVKRAPRYYS